MGQRQATGAGGSRKCFGPKAGRSRSLVPEKHTGSHDVQNARPLKGSAITRISQHSGTGVGGGAVEELLQPALQWQSRAHTGAGLRKASLFRFCSSGIICGRPSRLPPLRARARPARTRSWMMARSNSANKVMRFMYLRGSREALCQRCKVKQQQQQQLYSEFLKSVSCARFHSQNEKGTRRLLPVAPLPPLLTMPAPTRCEPSWRATSHRVPSRCRER